jgi:GntR family transcriptional regulator
MTSTDAPGYRRIADMIRARIADGTLAPGAELAGEEAAAGQWGVSRMTARRAYTYLRDQGMVVSHPGARWTVADIKRRVVHVMRSADHVTGAEAPSWAVDAWRWDMIHQGAEPEPVRPRVEIREAPPEVAARMGSADRVVERRNVRKIGDRVDSVFLMWFPARLAERSPLARPEPFGRGALAWVEERWGPLSHRLQFVARPPGPEDEVLHLAPGWPVQDVWRRSWSAEAGRVVAVSLSSYAADRLVLELDLDGRWGSAALPQIGCER